MKCNVGRLDQVLRIAIGLVLIGLAAYGAIGVWGYVGLLPLFSGALRFCPAYLPFGLKTCCGKDGQTKAGKCC